MTEFTKVHRLKDVLFHKFTAVIKQKHPIGVFDSGYGGLTILKEIVAHLPQYDYVYLGDNARAPYGSRSYESVYHYTLECVNLLFDKGCELVILACNTASAKALRTIQQRDLPKIAPHKRVLGVIRPTSEIIGSLSENGHVGILGTTGTVNSGSYLLEIEKFYPELRVSQEACPMWVPLIENNQVNNPGSDYFIELHTKALLKKDPQIDTIVLACTHYPLIVNAIKKFIPNHVQLVAQGPLIAHGLHDYLLRHPEMETLCTRNGEVEFYTTDNPEFFDEPASRFYGQSIQSKHIHL